MYSETKIQSNVTSDLQGSSFALFSILPWMRNWLYTCHQTKGNLFSLEAKQLWKTDLRDEAKHAHCK